MHNILPRLFLGAFDDCAQVAGSSIDAVMTLCETKPLLPADCQHCHLPIPDEVYLKHYTWDGLVRGLMGLLHKQYTVLVHCRDQVRKQRIIDESRVRMRKLTDPDSVDTSQDRNDLLSPLPGRETLIIDTSDISPDESATQIINHFGLRTI